MAEEIRRVQRIEGREDNRVALVFSCPGQVEEKTGILVNGQTGVNLEILLRMLHDSLPEIFRYTIKGDYRVTNASNIVHFAGNGNGTEPGKKEIRDPENLKRLVEDLKGDAWVFTFGAKANEAVDLVRSDLDPGTRVMRVPHHVGMQGINRILIDHMADPDLTNTEKRLKVVHDKILVLMEKD
ncbi:MAG TPA: hypothetical protein VLN47_10050 [Clostridiaceae bacterium]|nr:hypothetical protein [Clostridiaceae bacterium]